MVFGITKALKWVSILSRFYIIYSILNRNMRNALKTTYYWNNASSGMPLRSSVNARFAQLRG